MRYQQAVYGSFAFWDRGYALLARSAGCRGEWLGEFQRACRMLGEPPAETEFERSWFARRLLDGGWMIVGVHPQGHDDHGRPGALAFHGLFVDRLSYSWVGADPFPLAALTRGDWTAADRDTELPTGGWRRPRGPSPPPAHPLVEPIARALASKRPVVVHAARPIDDLANAVWRVLPWRTRTRCSLSTWAFDNANRFDLVAMPKLRGTTYAPESLILEQER